MPPGRDDSTAPAGPEAGRPETSLAPPAEPQARPAAAGPTILQVLPTLGTGGAERGCVDVAAAVVRAGGYAAVASAGGPLEHELFRAGALHYPLPLNTKNPLRIRANIGRLQALIDRTGAHLVHARSRAPAWSALAAARRAGIPFITTVHAPYGAGTAAKRAYNAVMARGDRVIAISHHVADYLRSTYPIDGGRIRVIHRGIDFRRFDPERVSGERVAALARAWRLPDGVPVVLMPARLSRWKGQAVLLEALARLGPAHLRCLIVGAERPGSSYRADLERQVARLRLGGIVHVAPHCDDMPAAYKLADVVVHASTEPEGFGRVIVEAQALGRPVIASDLGAPRELVRPGETGWLTPPGDPAALAAALEEALALEPEPRAALAGRAIAFARERFDVDRMTDAVLDVYEEVLREAILAGQAASAPDER